MEPRPPSSTLFPYTTLFRSWPPDRALSLQLQRLPLPLCAVAARARRRRGRGLPLQLPFQPGREGGEDRKSTRLNSSHSQISYAVFCLKKKTKSQLSLASGTA